MDTYDQHIFVVAAVEDHDLTVARRVGMDAPQVVVGKLDRRGHLERGDIHALRVDPIKDVADCAVFAASVHSLQNDEYFVLVFGIEQLLQCFQAPGEFGLNLCSLIFSAVEVALVVGVPLAQFNFMAGFDAIVIDVHEASPSLRSCL